MLVITQADRRTSVPRPFGRSLVSTGWLCHGQPHSHPTLFSLYKRHPETQLNCQFLTQLIPAFGVQGGWAEAGAYAAVELSKW